MSRFFDLVSHPPSYPAFFWKGRSAKKAYLGFGQGVSSSFIFKAHAFYDEPLQGIWKGFPHRWEFNPDQIISSNWDSSEAHYQIPPCIKKENLPSFEKWCHLVQDIKEKIELGHFSKVVLARQVSLTFADAILPYEFLKLLMNSLHSTALLMVQLDPQTAFLSSTPELLFTREGNVIKTEALAGTLLEQERWSPKEFAEVDAVRIFLQDQLFPICQSLQWMQPEEKKFHHLKHLYQRVEGVLKPGISDEKLIKHLHPTPALGGTPTQAALSYLKANEPFDRGWYGAPMGLTSDFSSEFAVAIRSVLIRGKDVYLFSGAGIMKDSDPEKEWEEIDRKIDHLLKRIHFTE